MPGTLIIRGNILYEFLVQPTLTPVSVAANTTAEQSFTVPGVLPSDSVSVNAQVAMTAGTSITNVRVSAANTLTIAFGNATIGALTPATGAYLLCICRPETLPLPTTAG